MRSEAIGPKLAFNVLATPSLPNIVVLNHITIVDNGSMKFMES